MSLHTKYRPSNFEGVLGQDSVVQSLLRVIEDKRAKAFIFAGPSGTGKTTLARILANEFANQAATVANIEEIDAATNSGADAIRAVVGRTAYRAVGASPAKSIILDEAHRLSSAAWTVLLKPIEEPPSHIYWMLCTTEPGKIPKPIQTRCLRYDLKPVKDELIYELLLRVVEAEKFDVSEEVIEAVAEAAVGSPRMALVGLEACLQCVSASEARATLRNATSAPEAINLARWLVNGAKGGWPEAIITLKLLDGFDSESIRIAIVNYLSAVLMNTSGDKAKRLLRILECFLSTYSSSDGRAPLLHSLGLALNMDY